jgi:ATP-dependent DNA helicase PIF1
MTQEVALGILKSGANVFLTGEPGAGKTYTVNRYVEWLREHGIEPAITASTGIAATHIGGMTIHSWSGIGIKKRLTGDDYGRLLEKDRLVTRLTGTSVLIIDEISMLDTQTLDAVDGVCRSLRRDARPFGGLQVVFVGDFFQLPPVGRNDEEPPEFAFHSSAWREVDPTVCYLSEQHRQEDAAFLSLLGGLRRGMITERGLTLLRERQLVRPESTVHTRLYSHNVDVDRVNEERLARLEGEARVFEMESKGSAKFVESLKKSCLSPERLSLKIGARVMFTKNHPDGRFANGTLGDVAGFANDGAPVVRTLTGGEIIPSVMDWMMADGDRALAKLTQYPLRLAWAMTIHKSQGLTLDAAVMDLSQTFEFGQGYVALSRVRSSDGLFILGMNRRAFQVNPDVLDSDAGFRRASEAAAMTCIDTSPEDRLEAEAAFILASGGTLEKQEAKKKEKKLAPAKGATYDVTLALFKEGKNIEEIAKARDMVTSTICNHIEKLSMDGKLEKEDILRIVPAHLHNALPLLHETLKAGQGHLGPAYEKLRGKYSYEDLRFARMVM